MSRGRNVKVEALFGSSSFSSNTNLFLCCSYKTKVSYLANMKILHTADWHLGQRLLQMDRHEEFRLALDWLYAVIEKEEIEVLLVAGDIFDIGNPPNQARQLYYRFLRRLLGSSCRHIVITGGNHDSPAMLNAPRGEKAKLNITYIFFDFENGYKREK